jgi:hypothetical protein
VRVTGFDEGVNRKYQNLKGVTNRENIGVFILYFISNEGGKARWIPHTG